MVYARSVADGDMLVGSLGEHVWRAGCVAGSGLGPPDARTVRRTDMPLDPTLRQHQALMCAMQYPQDQRVTNSIMLVA